MEREFEGISRNENNSVLQSELKEVIGQLSAAFANLSGTLKKPNILLVGKTGAGKSSLVNAVFGSQFAETGSGEPITKHLHKYAPEGKSIVVYDTKGLEHGNHVEFIEEMKEFLSELRSSEDLAQHLHVVWYVIDMAHSRFQSFEESICKEVLQDVALFFILNKADTADSNQLEIIRNLILNCKIPNCKGIFEVVSDRKNYFFECCPICHKKNFLFKQKTKEIICDEIDCKSIVKIGRYSGLEQLVNETTQQLPDFARHCFVYAQEVSEIQKLKLARDIIFKCASNSSLKNSKNTANSLVNMAAHLAILWEYRFFPSVVSQEIAYQFYLNYSSKNLFHRLVLLLNDIINRSRNSVALSVLLGVELCRHLCEFKMKAVGCVLKPDHNYNNINNNNNNNNDNNIINDNVENNSNNNSNNNDSANGHTNISDSLLSSDSYIVDLQIDVNDELLLSIAKEIDKSTLEEVIDRLLYNKMVVYSTRNSLYSPFSVTKVKV